MSKAASLAGFATAISPPSDLTVGIITATTATFTGTSAVGLTTGTTAERPGSPDAGMIRYNSDTQQFEGYSTAWGGFGGASGASGDQIFYENDQSPSGSSGSHRATGSQSCCS